MALTPSSRWTGPKSHPQLEAEDSSGSTELQEPCDGPFLIRTYVRTRTTAGRGEDARALHGLRDRADLPPRTASPRRAAPAGSREGTRETYGSAPVALPSPGRSRRWRRRRRAPGSGSRSPAARSWSRRSRRSARRAGRESRPVRHRRRRARRVRPASRPSSQACRAARADRRSRRRAAGCARRTGRASGRPSTHSEAYACSSVASVLDAIGNTPFVRLRQVAPQNRAEVWVKLEYLNPSGSMKDRMALAMIEGAERDGLLEPGATVVEYTGGSTGPALALVCRAKGYRARIVISDCFTEERMQLMRSLGADVDVIPAVECKGRVTAEDIKRMIARANELASEPGHYATDQFNNPYIVAGMRESLGREIWRQTEGRVTAFCHGIGTASSVMGVSDALRPRGVFIQAHEPAGSAAISGGDRGSFLIQGWTGGVMPHWSPDKVDHVEAITDADALEMTRRLASDEGIFAGISTGANVVGAHRLAERLGPEAVIVTLAVDTGFKYMSVAPYTAVA